MLLSSSSSGRTTPRHLVGSHSSFLPPLRRFPLLLIFPRRHIVSPSSFSYFPLPFLLVVFSPPSSSSCRPSHLLVVVLGPVLSLGHREVWLVVVVRFAVRYGGVLLASSFTSGFAMRPSCCLRCSRGVLSLIVVVAVAGVVVRRRRRRHSLVGCIR